MTGINSFRADKRLPGALAQTHRLLTKLQTAVEDVSILVLGDSTGDDPGDWVDLFAEQLRAMFPTHTCRFAYWDTTTQTGYLAETVRQVGTGSPRLTTTLNTTVDNATTSIIIDNPNLLSFGGWPGAGVSPSPGSFYALIDNEAVLVTSNPSGSTSTRTWTVTRGQLGTTAAGHTAGATIKHLPQIKIWSGSHPGSLFDYAFGKFALIVKGTTPDLVFLNYGHNEGTQNDWLVTRHGVYGRIQAVCAEIQAYYPFADIIVIGQNPQVKNVYHAHRKIAYRDLCARAGFGFVDVHQAFLDYGAAWTSDLVLGDGVHPTAAGYQVWLAEVMRSFKAMDSVDRAIPERTHLADFLWRGGYAYLAEGFAGYTTGTPTGWALVDASNVCTKDTVTLDSVKGYSVKIAGDGVTAAAVGIKYTFSAALRAALAGKTFTILARMATPATWLNGSSSYGRISFVDNAGGYTAPAMALAKGSWIFQVLNWTAPTNFTSGVLTVYADSASNKDAVANVDRVSIVPGLLMRDAAYS